MKEMSQRLNIHANIDTKIKIMFPLVNQDIFEKCTNPFKKLLQFHHLVKNGSKFKENAHQTYLLITENIIKKSKDIRANRPYVYFKIIFSCTDRLNLTILWFYLPTYYYKNAILRKHVTIFYNNFKIKDLYMIFIITL